MPGEAPQELPPHEILDEIGRGLFGAVYRARDVSNGRVVALKVIREDVLTPDRTAAFLQEIRAAACLTHPHLLPILAVGFREGRPCYTTPLALNGRLSERRAQFAEPRAAADLIEKAARAVAAAHAHGLVHGLLKPSEILFDDNDQPRIGGFGLLSFFCSSEAIAATLPLDTPAYRAPEQLTGRPGVMEPAGDVWALGAILYELLNGDPPTPSRRMRRGTPPELEAVVFCALQKRVEDRYPSARALADDLERWLRAEPTVARPRPWWRRALGDLARRFRRNAP